MVNKLIRVKTHLGLFLVEHLQLWRKTFFFFKEQQLKREKLFKHFILLRIMSKETDFYMQRFFFIFGQERSEIDSKSSSSSSCQGNVIVMEKNCLNDEE